MYGRKTTGVIRSTVWVGPDGKVRKHWRRVAKAADHPAKVLDALAAGTWRSPALVCVHPLDGDGRGWAQRNADDGG